MKTFPYAVLVAVLVAVAPGAIADGISFKTVTAKETGIAPIIEKWKADELASHGDKKPSHRWWPWGLRV